MLAMTKNLEHHLSLAELESKTPEGARELAAAELMVRASTLLSKAFEQSGLTQRQLAESLGVTESRVSQILHGDGNVRLSTLARYLRATGYLARIEADPAEANVQPLKRRAPRRRGRTPDPHDVYATLVEHNGRKEIKITTLPEGVPHSAAEMSTTNKVGTTTTRLSFSGIGSRELNL